MSKQPAKTRGKFINARLTSTISISLVLFVLGLIAFLAVLANEVSVMVKENIGFSVVLQDNIKKEEVQKLQRTFAKAEFVKNVQYISKEDALKELSAELGENPEEFLGFNPLQASFEVKLHSPYANNDSIVQIEQSIRALSSGIQEFNYRKDVVQLVNDNMRRAGMVLLGLAVILMTISFTLINNTVRLSVYSKRFLINTMRLVGATPAFIRRPFLLSNILSGIVASLLAMAMLTGLIRYLMSEFLGFGALITPELLGIVFAIILGLGILITGIASFFAANRYIRMKSDDMYLV
ncbi:MAG: permease-like cell division protein FtsX [Bacteroidales bacterium]